MDQPSRPENPKSRSGTILVWFTFAGIIAIGLMVMLGMWMKKSDQDTLEIGEKVADFSLTTFENETYTLSELSGKVVLVNVWASWCYVCEDESDMIQEVWSELEPTGDFVFLGVDYVDTEKPALEFIAKHGMSYPNGPDLGSSISKIFKTTGVPETFLIGRDGVLVDIKIGPFTSSDDVREFLSQAVN